MKRHRHKLKKHSLRWKEKNERLHLVLSYFRKMTQEDAFALPAKLILTRKKLPISKICSYCIITGRVRYTITPALMSRHTFYSKTM